MNNENSIWDQLLKLKSLPFGSVHCIKSRVMDDEVKQLIIRAAEKNCLNDTEISSQFLKKYLEWIKSTKNNSLRGIENFTKVDFSNGTTESFDKFYMRHRTRRLRYFQGEYMYHVAAAKFSFDRSKLLDDGPIESNDVVVMSLPFAGTGNKHELTEEILNQCDRLSVPVLIDCCYFGVCGNVDFNFNHVSISEITFSLSKNFPVQHLRIGMRLSRNIDDDLLMIYNRNNYLNRVAAFVGLNIIDKYSSDYNYETYRSTQLKFCEDLGIFPSNCVFFGTSEDKFHEYNRGIKENRLCFSKYFESRELPNNVN